MPGQPGILREAEEGGGGLSRHASKTPELALNAAEGAPRSAPSYERAGGLT
jgi:hypothetical protein